MTRARRDFLMTVALSGVGVSALSAQQTSPDPWLAEALLDPSALAKTIQTAKNKPAIICVAFPVLYRQRHIPNSTFGGPTSKPEGIAALKESAAKLSKDAAVVIYCGCCPMVRCPNIRPAYRVLSDLGFANVQVLNLATNFHTDWAEKGYPVDPAVSTAGEKSAAISPGSVR